MAAWSGFGGGRLDDQRAAGSGAVVLGVSSVLGRGGSAAEAVDQVVSATGVVDLEGATSAALGPGGADPAATGSGPRGYRQRLEAGRQAFGHLIRVWHERNGWSQRVLPGLAEQLDLGRVHNSQLSNLRNGKLPSPGPEVFLALGAINHWLHREAPDGRLTAPHPQLEAVPEVQQALEAAAVALVDDRGRSLGPGDLLEIFVGLQQPPAAFDLRISEAEAPALSAALAALFTAGLPWRQCRDTLLAAYPADRRQRREQFADVMAGLRDYSAAELDAELPDLRRTLAALGVAGEDALGADQFLELLRQKARQCGLASGEGLDLAAAIRQGLSV